MVNRMTQHRSRAPLFLLYLKVIVIKNIHRDIRDDKKPKRRATIHSWPTLAAEPINDGQASPPPMGRKCRPTLTVPANEGCGT